MPTPSAEHAPIMRQLSDEILKEFPTASVFAWKVMHHYTIWPMDGPHVYVLAMHDADGEWIGGEQLNSPETRLLPATRTHSTGRPGRKALPLPTP